METQANPTLTPLHRLRPLNGLWPLLAAAGICLYAATSLSAATATIYGNDFEAYTDVATSLADTADADPTGVEWNVSDDTALEPTDVGAGVQVINWLGHGGSQSLLLRPGSEAQVMLRGARSGSSYQLDFWTYAVREAASDRNFYIVLRAEGADNNGDDCIAYQVNRATGSTILRYYDGVGPGAAAWVNTTANQTVNQWQHHRIVLNVNALTFTLWVDDMGTPVVADVDIARPDSAVPTQLRIINEGNSANDGYYAIDDISFTVEDSIDLTNPFTEGFETYAARTSPADDADPQGPWVTSETGGNGSGKLRTPEKVQVVGSDVVTPHSGNQCLKVEYGQRAGASIAWGVPPQSDVQVTWWAYVPSSATGGDYNYLRMSLYGTEGGNTYAGDCALLGYGCRSSTVGTATSLTYYEGSAWYLTGFDFTPVTWEEYQMTTHNGLRAYSIVKNPSSASPQVIVEHKPFVGSATNYGPIFMAAWSSSNGTNHPAAYVDDIEIKAVANQLPVPGTDTVKRPNLAGMKVPVATLLSNDSDADRDPVSILGVNTPTAQGGSVTMSGGWVFYTPPAGNPATDSFTYSLSDGRDAPVLGTVTVNMAAADTNPTQTVVGISTNGGGNVTITFAGIPGQSYVIEAATSLVAPVWVPLATNVAGPKGLFQFTDPEASSYPSRYYRTALP